MSLVVTKPAYTYRAQFRSNYDGDTIRLDVSLGFGIWAKDQIFRLYGIDTPEMRGEEKEKGKIARDFVTEALTDAEEIIIETFKDAKGKYGRWLARIWYFPAGSLLDPAAPPHCLNEELVNKGLAERYMD